MRRRAIVMVKGDRATLKCEVLLDSSDLTQEEATEAVLGAADILINNLGSIRYVYLRPAHATTKLGSR
jgi:hypothetical protein